VLIMAFARPYGEAFFFFFFFRAEASPCLISAVVRAARVLYVWITRRANARLPSRLFFPLMQLCFSVFFFWGAFASLSSLPGVSRVLGGFFCWEAERPLTFGGFF